MCKSVNIALSIVTFTFMVLGFILFSLANLPIAICKFVYEIITQIIGDSIEKGSDVASDLWEEVERIIKGKSK